MSLVEKYLAARDEHESAKDQLRIIAFILKDVARHIERRPDETCFGNLPDNDADRPRPGDKSFDATEFPDPVTIQRALDRRTDTFAALMDVWMAMPEQMKRGLLPPRAG